MLEVDRPSVDPLLLVVQVPDEIDDPAGIPELLNAGRKLALVGKGDAEVAVEEGGFPHVGGKRVPRILDRLEDLGVGPEGDLGPRRLRLAGGTQAPAGLPPLERHRPDLAVSLDLDLEPTRQRVHDADAHSVQTPGDLVATATELATRVQDGERHLHAGLPVLGNVVYGDAPAIICDRDRVVGVDDDIDRGAEPCQRFVHRVVDDLVDQVVEAFGTCRANVHARSLANRFKAFEDLDIFAGIRAFGHAASSVGARSVDVEAGVRRPRYVVVLPAQVYHKWWLQPVSAGTCRPPGEPPSGTVHEPV